MLNFYLLFLCQFLSCNGYSSFKLLGKQLLVGEFCVILRYFDRAVLVKHEIFDVLGIALRTEDKADR